MLDVFLTDVIQILENEGLLIPRLAQRGHVGRAGRFEVTAHVPQLDANLLECLGEMHRVVPIHFPKTGLAYVGYQCFPLFVGKHRLDVGRMEMENRVQLITVPLADDLVAFGDVIHDGLYHAIIVGIDRFDGEVFTETKHLIAQA